MALKTLVVLIIQFMEFYVHLLLLLSQEIFNWYKAIMLLQNQFHENLDSRIFFFLFHKVSHEFLYFIFFGW